MQAVTNEQLAPSLLHIQQLRTLGAPLGATETRDQHVNREQHPLGHESIYDPDGS